MHRTILISIGTALALGGCYTGLDGQPGRGGGALSGGGADDAADDGEPGADDAPAAQDEDEHPFEVPGEEVRLLPFPVRMQNLANVTGASLTHPIFFELYELRYQLGDHDFSQLVAPDLRWSPQKMQNWVRGLVPVCESTVVRAKYPDLVANPEPLMRDAFGRDPTPADLEPLADIAASSHDDAIKYQLTCLSVLSSLEFVAS